MDDTITSAQTVLGSLVVQYSTAAVVATAAVAWIVRTLRRDLRDANLDKASDAIIAAQAADIKSLRERLDANDTAREKLREELTSVRSEFSTKLATLNADFAMLQRENMALRIENTKLHDEITAARAETAKAREEIYGLQMQCSGQLSTIEDLQLKIRNLEAINTKASLAGRRKTDPKPDDD